MSSGSYEVLALLARYWFVFLMGLIVARGLRVCYKDSKNARIFRAWGGGSGCVGEMIMSEAGFYTHKKIKRFPVPREAVLGSAGSADICIRHRDIKRRHVYMKYSEGKMILYPFMNTDIAAMHTENGAWILRDGDTLRIGRVSLNMVFFNTDEAARISGIHKKAAQILPEDVSDDEFEDAWKEESSTISTDMFSRKRKILGLDRILGRKYYCAYSRRGRVLRRRRHHG